ncbi:MAG: DUF4132 domain-containing protein [Gammaproteobacteria bacterium]
MLASQGPDAVLRTVFDSPSHPLLDDPALVHYLDEHAKDVARIAPKLTEHGQAALLAMLASLPALPDPLPPLLVRLAVRGRFEVSRRATALLRGLEPARWQGELDGALADREAEVRQRAADIALRTGLPDAAARIERAIAVESRISVRQAMRTLLLQERIGGPVVVPELPAPPVAPSADTAPLGDEALECFRSNRAAREQHLRARLAQDGDARPATSSSQHWAAAALERHGRIDDNHLQQALRALNGECSDNDSAILGDADLHAVLNFDLGWLELPGCGFPHLLRWLRYSAPFRYGLGYEHYFQTWMKKQEPGSLDARTMTQQCIAAGLPAYEISTGCIDYGWGRPGKAVGPERAWPLFGVLPEVIDEGLAPLPPGERRVFNDDAPIHAMDLLAVFPLLPARWHARLMELALCDNRAYRERAQALLERLPDVVERVSAQLGSSIQDERIQAARWIGRMDARSAIPALYRTLEAESRETVTAALLTVLEQMGEDLATWFAPAKLLAQAQKALKAKPPAGLAWLNLDLLPPCAWRDGTPVEPAIVRWWVTLAHKLKEPAGNAILERYLALLDAPSRAALGAFLLHAFIARDTTHPSEEEASDFAHTYAPQVQSRQMSIYQLFPDLQEVGALEGDALFTFIKRRKLAEYVTTAINDKGLLALIHGVPAQQLVATISHYMRDNHRRRFQIEALLEAASLARENAVIQFILGISRRHRTASVKEKAGVLVQRIAERAGWSQDELADRTIPTGGLDEHGVLTLPYGSRTFTVTLDAKMKPVLKDADGKPVAALPAPRQTDDEEAIKEGKALLATCKKEVKQVIDVQTPRLYEAMCSGRQWPVAEWRACLQQHPVAGRLVQRLVWQALDPSGAVLASFRPSEDGTLIDWRDEEVDLPGDAQVRLAHAVLMPAQEAAAWSRHLKDYKISALFEQMKRVPDADASPDRFVGWMSDTFTLRSAFTKLGYQRGVAEDGPIFVDYNKEFVSAGVGVRIEFSGNTLPEENHPAALKSLSFYSLERFRGGEREVPPARVPPVLLAEALLDYATVAEVGSFDAGWRDRTPWA